MNNYTLRKLIPTLFILFMLVGCATYTVPEYTDNMSATHNSSPDEPELQTITEADIRILLLWKRPQGTGPFPTIIVHPGRGETIFELRDILTTLSEHGFMAVAAGYQRRSQDRYRDTLLPWRSLDDARLVVEAVSGNPLVDNERIGTLGFSLGGAHSLLLAAGSDDVKTAVVYYPMTDFPSWIEEKRKTNLFWRMMMGMWRNRYESERQAESTGSLQDLLTFYSPINHTQDIDIPLLIIHGDRDRTTPLEHSRELNQQLLVAGNEQTALLIMDNAAHAFNFRSKGYKEATTKGWEATLNWLGQHLETDKDINIALNTP